MKIYPEMIFSGGATDLRDLIGRLDAAETIGHWTRNQEAEHSITGLISEEGSVRAYRHQPSDGLTEADLWLSLANNEARVTNIIPLGPEQLAPEEYCALLLNFRSAVLPYSASHAVTISIPVAVVGPEYFLSKDAARLLHQFSLLANKSTGASHPRDVARWNAFILRVHRDGCPIASTELQQILMEHEHWPEDKAAELSVLFEYETSLLNALAEAS